MATTRTIPADTRQSHEAFVHITLNKLILFWEERERAMAGALRPVPPWRSVFLSWAGVLVAQHHAKQSIHQSRVRRSAAHRDVRHNPHIAIAHDLHQLHDRVALRA